MHGQNDVAAARKPAESETYALKLTQLLLPRDNHRIGFLANLKNRYATTTQPREPSEVYDASLGTIGAIGFVWLLVVLATGALGNRRRLPRVIRDSRPAAVAGATAFLLGSVGGFSALFAYLITPQLRAWNRISIFIAFFSLLAIGLLLERARQALSGSRRQRGFFVAVLATVLAVGFADQTAPADIPNYASLDAHYENDGVFIRSIETVLPHGAMVFELPYQAFPEGSKIGGVDRYDPVRPYLHSTHLRWSYGAMVGRPEDWQASLIGRLPSEIAAGVAASGFSGLYVDLAGYGRDGPKMEMALHRILGVRPRSSIGGRLAFYDLRPYATKLRSLYGRQAIARLRTGTLTPPRVEAESGISAVRFENVIGGQTWFIKGRRASVSLYEPSESETVVVQTRVSVGGAGRGEPPVDVELRWPDGSTTQLLISRTALVIERRIRLIHGDNIVGIEAKAGWAPGLRLRFQRTRFELHAFDPFQTTATSFRPTYVQVTRQPPMSTRHVASALAAATRWATLLGVP